MSWWILLSVLPGNTLTHKKKEKKKEKKSTIVLKCLESLKIRVKEWKVINATGTVCFISLCSCSRLSSLYFCCLLLLCVCFAVYSVPALVMNVLYPQLLQTCTTCSSTHGGARRQRKFLQMFDQRCCLCKQTRRWRIWMDRKVLFVCLRSVLRGRPPSSCLFFVLSVQWIFNCNHFSTKKAFTNFLFFVIYIYIFFCPICVSSFVSFVGEMCWNCDSVKMWTQHRGIDHSLVLAGFPSVDQHSFRKRGRNHALIFPPLAPPCGWHFWFMKLFNNSRMDCHKFFIQTFMSINFYQEPSSG